RPGLRRGRHLAWDAPLVVGQLALDRPLGGAALRQRFTRRGEPGLGAPWSEQVGAVGAVRRAGQVRPRRQAGWWRCRPGVPATVAVVAVVAGRRRWAAEAGRYCRGGGVGPGPAAEP